MATKVVLAVLVLVAAATAVPQPAAGNWPGTGGWGAGGANPWIPPWISAAPWYPQWSPCTTIGTSCFDCTTKTVCTKVGGLQRACTDPTLPYCNLGECSATPTAECAPAESQA